MKLSIVTAVVLILSASVYAAGTSTPPQIKKTLSNRELYCSDPWVQMRSKPVTQINCMEGGSFEILLVGNTKVKLNKCLRGHVFNLKFVQDQSGGHSITFDKVVYKGIPIGSPYGMTFIGILVDRKGPIVTYSYNMTP